MRNVAVALMFGLALVVALVPQVAKPSPGTEPGQEPPPISICPLLEVADRHTELAILSSVNGQGRVSAFAAGSELGSIDFSTGATGSVRLPATESGAVATSGGLVEMPSDTTTAGVIVSGPSVLAAEGCAISPSTQMVVSGGSTVEGGLQIQLLNPYAGEATVDLVVATETGLESDERFQAVIVPPLSTVTLDMEVIIPGRERITAAIETTRGSVVATARQLIGEQMALWRAVEPAGDWWLPVPSGGERKELIVTNPSAGEVEYQVDFYGPEGLVEAMETGILNGRGEVRFPLTEVTTEAVAVRVISTAPVGATLWAQSAEALAATTGSPTDSSTWLLPGAHGPAGGSGTLVVLNSGLEPAMVSVRTLVDQSVVRDFELEAGDLLETPLVAANGYRVEASGPVVALWQAQVGGDGSLAIGHPLTDG